MKVIFLQDFKEYEKGAIIDVSEELGAYSLIPLGIAVNYTDDMIQLLINDNKMGPYINKFLDNQIKKVMDFVKNNVFIFKRRLNSNNEMRSVSRFDIVEYIVRNTGIPIDVVFIDTKEITTFGNHTMILYFLINAEEGEEYPLINISVVEYE